MSVVAGYVKALRAIGNLLILELINCLSYITMFIYMIIQTK
jgi:hypothetical protein